PMTRTSDVVKRLQLPRQTVDRTLQELHLLELLVVDEEPYGDGKHRWLYRLAETVDAKTLPNLTRKVTTPYRGARLNDTSTITWDDLHPNGRIVFYEGDDPDGFAAEMRTLGIDVRAPIPDGWSTTWDTARVFFIPPGHVEEIYGSERWKLGS